MNRPACRDNSRSVLAKDRLGSAGVGYRAFDRLDDGQRVARVGEGGQRLTTAVEDRNEMGELGVEAVYVVYDPPRGPAIVLDQGVVPAEACAPLLPRILWRTVQGSAVWSKAAKLTQRLASAPSAGGRRR